MAGTKSSRRQQSRLAFTPLPSSSPAAKGYHQQTRDRAAAVIVDSPAKRRKLTHNNDHESIPTPAASHEEEDNGSDSEPVRATQRLSTQQASKKSRRATQKRLDFSSSRDPESFSSPVKLASSPSRPQATGKAGMFSSQRHQHQVADLSSEESEEELPSAQALVSRGRSSQRRKTKDVGRKTRSTQQPVTVDESDDDVILNTNARSSAIPIDSDDENEDDDMPTTLGKQQRKPKRRGSHNSFISSSPPRMASSDSELEIIEQPRKRRRNDEDDDEVELVTPRHRKLTQRQKEELAEDVDDLRSSSPERPPRATQSSQKTARLTALEQLRRKRAGAPQVVEESEESDGDQAEGSEHSGEDEDEDEVEQAAMSSARDFFREDEYDAAFVEEEDGDGPIGILDDVPIEFTRYATMRPKELFKHAVEWMVQKKINPAFASTDPLYELTFRKLNDETKGLVGSKYMSTVWTEKFTFALKARPELAEGHCDGADHPTCDACNRSNHPATFQIQFQGKPYDRETLEELAGNEGDYKPAYDDEGHKILPELHSFYVGKFCRANAVTAHALHHWRYHLKDAVIDWLDRQGYLSPKAIVERDGWGTVKREDLANDIADRMEKEGEVKKLWQRFKKNVDAARNAKQGGRFMIDV
ncbi:hypothetical protein LTR09_000628 [Extremus antarcticus]|uniref:DUF4211 domain-containing protein n=1 Tax=Extremus antarcticus TaxID=702011 RepID=A0AAJ0GJZ5_9PEZI|nr:hypothetical protein LTR09_000628 [Extremus antarcticus]